MNYLAAARPALVIAAALLGGCVSNPGIVETAPGSYLLARTDPGGSFGNVAATKAAMVREAGDFAAKQGKVAVPLAMKDTPMAIEGHTAVEYRFQVVDKAQAPAAASAQASAPTPAATAATKSTHGERTGDLYADLIKLDELRKRGILTDAEFDSQKKKLLNAN